MMKRSRGTGSSRTRASGRAAIRAVTAVAVLLLGVATTIGAPQPAAAAGPSVDVRVWSTTVLRPQGITIGPDGKVWFTNSTLGGWSDSHSVGRVDADGSVRTFTDSQIGNPTSIVTGGDGNLWTVNAGYPVPGTMSGGQVTGQGVSRVAPDGTIATFRPSLLTVPLGIAPGSDGNVWVTNQHYGSAFFGYTGTPGLVRFAPDGTATMFTAPGISPSSAITTGPDGNLWFGNGFSIGRMTTAGAYTAFSGPNIWDVTSITPGPDGALWFTERLMNRIGRIATDGTLATFTDPTIVNPISITSGSDGALWFTNANDTLGRITTAGVVTAVTDPSVHSPQAITTAPDGQLWWANNGDDSIGHRPPAGTSATIAGNGIDSPGRAVRGGDGNMWFPEMGETPGITTISSAGTVTTFALQNRPTTPLVLGPDGDLWFSEGGTNIAHIAPTGTITRYPVATGGALIQTLTLATDGNFWFTMGASFGRVTPAGVITLFPVAGVASIGEVIVGPGGALWFTYGQSGSSNPTGIGTITTSGTPTLFPGIANPRGMVVGGDGNVWFTSNGAPARITPAGAVTTFANASIGTEPPLLAADGNLWTAAWGPAIVRITSTGGVTSFPFVGSPGLYRLVLDADGIPWFSKSDHLVRVGLDGTMTDLPAPGLQGSGAMSVGAPGTFWLPTGFSITRATVVEAPTDPPQVLGLDHHVGSVAGGETVTLHGNHFHGTTRVTFGSHPSTDASSFTVVDDTTITAVAPAHTVGLVNVTVTSPIGSSANQPMSWYAYRDGPAPTILSVTPRQPDGTLFSTTTVTITGSDFVHVGQVFFGTAPADSFTVVDSTTIVATISWAPLGLVNVRVRGLNGTSAPGTASWFRFTPS